MNDDAVRYRLDEFRKKKFKHDERFMVIHDILLVPLLPELIENNNKVYKTKICKNDTGRVTSIKLLYEREKRPGLFNWLIRMFFPWRTGVKIYENNRLFLCEYYKHNFFSLVDNLKTEYYSKLKSHLFYDLTVINKT